MLVFRRVTPIIKFAGTHLYTWVEKGTMRIKCLASASSPVARAKFKLIPALELLTRYQAPARTLFFSPSLPSAKKNYKKSLWRRQVLPKNKTQFLGPGARFSKLPVTIGPVKLFCFPFQMGVSKVLKIIQ